MGKTAKVQLAKILVAVGYSPSKVLRAVGYPRCSSISLGTTGTAIQIKVAVDSGAKKYELAEDGRSSVISPKALPSLDHIEVSSEDAADGLIFYFNFESGNFAKIVTHGNLSIPPPPDWPQLDFIEPQYPIPVS